MDFSSYGPAARSVIFQARAECAQAGETAIRPEHLLIALAACDATAPLLAEAGIELEQLREQTISASGRRPATAVRAGFAMRDLTRDALRLCASTSGQIEPRDILAALAQTWVLLRPASFLFEPAVRAA